MLDLRRVLLPVLVCVCGAACADDSLTAPPLARNAAAALRLDRGVGSGAVVDTANYSATEDRNGNTMGSGH